MLVDVNALKETERKIGEARDFAQAVIESVPPLVILEPDLRVRSANQAFYATFGVTAEQTEGRLITNWETGNGDRAATAGRDFAAQQAVQQDQVTHDFEAIGRRTMLISGRQVESKSCIVLSIEDISEQREAREVLARSKEDLERLVGERTARLAELVGELEHFSHTITHDMRAPLRGMRGFAEMMVEACAGCQEQERKDLLQRIVKSANRMDLLITDVLSYSKAVKQELVGPVDAGRCCKGSSIRTPNWLSKARIEIQGEIPRVLANEAGLTQCFSNLLDNAVKFVKQGELPRVDIRAEPREGWVRLWFEDSGIGIPKEMLARVFDMFSRLGTRAMKARGSAWRWCKR